MFKRRKRQKEYRIKRLRTKTWAEIVWGEVMLFAGVLRITFASLKEILASDEQDCSSEDFRRHDFGDSDWIEHDSGLFEHESDDMVRGQWDITSIYYPICHSDD